MASAPPPPPRKRGAVSRTGDLPTYLAFLSQLSKSELKNLLPRLPREIKEYISTFLDIEGKQMPSSRRRLGEGRKRRKPKKKL